MKRSQSIRQMRRAVSAKDEYWQFINKVYEDFKVFLLALLIIVMAVFLFRYFVVIEFGSVENWWNSGKQVQEK